ncbi:hypothetical protein DFH11DRAFT_1880653 [Phellopilus nigrolimitatus]|nr:hypothetical protein DFH11DRAFT_1880653 [Phellopilus nigrolimitatus]
MASQGAPAQTTTNVSFLVSIFSPPIFFPFFARAMATTRPSRRLFLHVSALSDTEYAVYVDALHDLLDDGNCAVPDDELERKQVGVREVRAWMKGRFRDLGVGEIDKVLQLFVPQMAQKDALAGGQLLAAGSDVGEGNVFVQAEPSSPSTSRFSFPASRLKQLDPPTPDLPIEPTHDSTHPTSTSRGNPFFLDPFLPDPNPNSSNPHTNPPHSAPARPHPPPAHPSLTPSSKPNAPSARRASLSSAPPIPPVSSKPRAEGAGAMGVRPGSTNPFLQRAKTLSGAIKSSNGTGTGKTPPLPPRKPAHMSGQGPALLPPPPPPTKPFLPTSVPTLHAHSSSVSSNSNSGSSTANQLNPPPPPPHRVTPLMQQSLLASRAGATLKRAKDQAGRTRVLEVIRSSADVVQPKEAVQGVSRSPDKGARRPVPRPPSPKSARSSVSAYSEAQSAGSLEQIAGARLRSRRRTRSPGRTSFSSTDALSESEQEREREKGRQPSTSEQFAVPPMHPARRPSLHSNSAKSVSGPGSVTGRHVRSPSYQSYHSPKSSPNSAALTPSSSSSSPTPSPVSPTGYPRGARSHSMHQTSSPGESSGRLSPPLPPPRRRRPESVQITPRPRTLDVDGDGDGDGSSPFTNAFTAALEKRAGAGRFARLELDGPKKEREREREDERPPPPHAFAQLQRTFSALQQRAQPTLARARYKAEAGLAPRRGFVPNGRDYHLAGEAGDRLVHGGGGGDDDADAGMDVDYVRSTGADSDEGYAGEWGSGVDGEGDEGGDGNGDKDATVRGRGRGRSAYERDELKLPEGEGWAPL